MKNKTILVSPLEWGLGHSARLISVINACLERGWDVVIAADGRPLSFLRAKFPSLPYEVFPFVKIRYSRNENFIRRLIPQLPGIIRAIRKNRSSLNHLVQKYHIDAIIGDHRYGISHRDKPSVFISNQIWLLAPMGWRFAEKLVFKIHLYYLRKFDYIWLADFPDSPNFTGIQTHFPKQYPNHRYIGPVSRFKRGMVNVDVVEFEPELLVILSGPEPQRSILEEIIRNIFSSTDKKVVILRGLPASGGNILPDPKIDDNIVWYDHADDATIAGLILKAGKIITRPGLSMLSDLAALERTALLVPTPGQTEQNYMAARLAAGAYFEVVNQRDLNLDLIDSFNPENYNLFPTPDLEALNFALDELFEN